MVNMPWSDDRIARLRTLRANGESASVIAAQLGGGATRNSVLGKAHRLGMVSPKPRHVAQKKPKPEAVAKPVRPQPSMPEPTPKAPPPLPLLPPVAEAADTSGRTTVATLEGHMCKFPIGDPCDPDFTFCAAPQRDGKVYCDHHCVIAYQANKAN